VFEDQDPLPSGASPNAGRPKAVPPTHSADERTKRGLQTLAWRAADDENDEPVDLRRPVQAEEGENDLEAAAPRPASRKPSWYGTRERVPPNGTYFVKIVASDSPSNAPAGASLDDRRDG